MSAEQKLQKQMQYWCGQMMPEQASACDAMWSAVRPPLPPDASQPGSELTDIDSELLRLLEEAAAGQERDEAACASGDSDCGLRTPTRCVAEEFATPS
jgi:hypothetical protein